MMTDKEMRDYDMLVEWGIATPDELNLAFNMTNKGWTYTINKIVEIRTDYRTLESYIANEMEEE